MVSVLRFESHLARSLPPKMGTARSAPGPHLLQVLGKFFEWVKKIGVWGPVSMAAIYAVATVFFFPGLILTLG